MFGFQSINFNNAITPATSGAAEVMDLYDQIIEKKNNYISTKISADNNKRASATAIGATGGFLQAAALTGIYALVKTFPKLNIPIINKLVTKNFDNWINIAAKQNPNNSKLHNVIIGLMSKYVWAVLTGAAIGFGFGAYDTHRQTRVNGKISNVKSGANGSWIPSALTALSANPKGAEVIKNSINKNKNGSVTVKFAGINREYNITKKELSKASRDYVAICDDKGNVKDYRKKFAKGDGDVLAFEIAFEKYCKEVHDGVIPQDENISGVGYKINNDGDILFNNGSVNDLFYLLTGKKTHSFNSSVKYNNPILDMYNKSSLNKFLFDLAEKKDNYSAEIKFKADGKDFVVRDKNLRLKKINTDKGYAITKINSKYVTLANSDKTREKIEVPISRLNKYIASAQYTKLSDN